MSSIPPPSRRWTTRVLLPLALLAATGALLLGSAWASLFPGPGVRVIPVILKTAEASSTGTTVVASGWLEPDPYPTYATALENGVVEELLVLEGDRVSRGDVLARLVADDARLALDRAEATLAARHADRDRAQADLDASREVLETLIDRRERLAVAEAKVAEVDGSLAQLVADIAVENAKLAELRDQYDRKVPLVESGAVSAGALRRLELAIEAQDARLRATSLRRPVLEHQRASAIAVQAAAAQHSELRIEERLRIRVAESSLAAATAAVNLATAARTEAQLRLRRMEIVAPIDGVVMRRLASPGSKVETAGDAHSAHVYHLYDPDHLQVRVDVPLADAGGVVVGQSAEITIQVLPDRVFTGTVTRFVHLADVQKNTVEVKVALKEPALELKPDMLARVRFLATGGRPVSRQRLFAPADRIHGDEETGSVWIVVDRLAERGVAELRRVKLAPGGATIEGWREVADGLSPGDWIIDEVPAGIQPGDPVTIEGEVER